MARAQIGVDYLNVPQYLTELKLTIQVEPGRCTITADDPRCWHAEARIGRFRLPGVWSSKPVHGERSMQAFRVAVLEVFRELEAVVKGQGQG